MDTQQKGDLAELRYAARLKEIGHDVLFPYSENCQYDLAADTGDEIVKIQVKSSNFDDGSIHFSCHGTASSPNSTETFYTNEVIDGIGVYSDELDECFFVSVQDINKYSMTIGLDPDSKHPASQYSLKNL